MSLKKLFLKKVQASKKRILWTSIKSRERKTLVVYMLMLVWQLLLFSIFVHISLQLKGRKLIVLVCTLKEVDKV